MAPKNEGGSSASRFERGVEAVVGGDIAALELYLHEDPELIRARSDREHHATLLHYVSANGVEDQRQRIPPTVVQVARTLLEAGAEVDALADMYGGHLATLELVASSIHPARAGVQVALIELLLDYGAAIDGPSEGGPPVMAALANGRLEAAKTLARRGARLDLVAGAALGCLDVVKGIVAQEGFSREHGAQLERAFLWACQYGQTAVVEFLLQTGVDPTASDEQQQTGLHHAALGHQVDVVRMLLERQAPLEAVNAFGGTVLAQAVWSALHAESPAEYLSVLELLLNAGADVRAAGYPMGNQQVDELLRRYGARAIEGQGTV